MNVCAHGIAPVSAPYVRRALFKAPSAGAFGSDMVAPGMPPAPPWIAEFDPARDAIEVACEMNGRRPTLALIESEARTELRLNGIVIARFVSGTPVSLSDILLVPRNRPAQVGMSQGTG